MPIGTSPLFFIEKYRTKGLQKFICYGILIKQSESNGRFIEHLKSMGA